MGNLLNCCSSKRREDSQIDLGAELLEPIDFIGNEKRQRNIEDIFKKSAEMDAYLEKHLGDPTPHIDQFGLLSFDYFLKIYKTALIWNRISFADKKKELVAERREALKKGNLELYGELQQQIIDTDEACMQDVLQEILRTIGMSDKQFQGSLNHHMDDQANLEVIRGVQQESSMEIEQNSQKQPRKGQLNRNEVMSAQKVLQNLSIEQIEKLKVLAPAQIENEMPLLRVKLEDRFFIVTGIEIDELEFCTRELNLENDAEYIKMMKEYNEKLELLYKQQ